MSLVPLNFFVQHDGRSARQHVTCRYKCGDACSQPVPNASANEYFGDVVQRVSRRTMLRTTGVTVGYPYTALVDFRSGRVGFCRTVGQPGEGGYTRRPEVATAAACGG